MWNSSIAMSEQQSHQLDLRSAIGVVMTPNIAVNLYKVAQKYLTLNYKFPNGLNKQHELLELGLDNGAWNPARTCALKILKKNCQTWCLEHIRYSVDPFSEMRTSMFQHICDPELDRSIRDSIRTCLAFTCIPNFRDHWNTIVSFLAMSTANSDLIVILSQINHSLSEDYMSSNSFLTPVLSSIQNAPQNEWQFLQVTRLLHDISYHFCWAGLKSDEVNQLNFTLLCALGVQLFHYTFLILKTCDNSLSFCRHLNSSIGLVRNTFTKRLFPSSQTPMVLEYIVNAFTYTITTYRGVIDASEPYQFLDRLYAISTSEEAVKVRRTLQESAGSTTPFVTDEKNCGYLYDCVGSFAQTMSIIFPAAFTGGTSPLLYSRGHMQMENSMVEQFTELAETLFETIDFHLLISLLYRSFKNFSRIFTLLVSVASSHINSARIFVERLSFSDLLFGLGPLVMYPVKSYEYFEKNLLDTVRFLNYLLVTVPMLPTSLLARICPQKEMMSTVAESFKRLCSVHLELQPYESTKKIFERCLAVILHFKYRTYFKESHTHPLYVATLYHSIAFICTTTILSEGVHRHSDREMFASAINQAWLPYVREMQNRWKQLSPQNERITMSTSTNSHTFLQGFVSLSPSTNGYSRKEEYVTKHSKFVAATQERIRSWDPSCDDAYYSIFLAVNPCMFLLYERLIYLRKNDVDTRILGTVDDRDDMSLLSGLQSSFNESSINFTIDRWATVLTQEKFTDWERKIIKRGCEIGYAAVLPALLVPISLMKKSRMCPKMVLELLRLFKSYHCIDEKTNPEVFSLLPIKFAIDGLWNSFLHLDGILWPELLQVFITKACESVQQQIQIVEIDPYPHIDDYFYASLNNLQLVNFQPYFHETTTYEKGNSNQPSPLSMVSPLLDLLQVSMKFLKHDSKMVIQINRLLDNIMKLLVKCISDQNISTNELAFYQQRIVSKKFYENLNRIIALPSVHYYGLSFCISGLMNYMLFESEYNRRITQRDDIRSFNLNSFSLIRHVVNITFEPRQNFEEILRRNHPQILMDSIETVLENFKRFGIENEIIPPLREYMEFCTKHGYY